MGTPFIITIPILLCVLLRNITLTYQFPKGLNVDNALYNSLNFDTSNQPIRIESVPVKVITNYTEDTQMTSVPVTVNDLSMDLNTPVLDIGINPFSFQVGDGLIQTDNVKVESKEIDETPKKETKQKKVSKKKIPNEEEENNGLVEIQMFIFMMLLLIMVVNMSIDVPNSIMAIIIGVSAIICAVIYNNEFFFGRRKESV